MAGFFLRWKIRWLIDRIIAEGEYSDAVESLVKAGRPAVELLTIALKSDNSAVRTGVAKALLRIGGVPVEVWVDVLQDRDEHLRCLAIEALGKAEDREGLPFLIGALEDSSHRVCGSAILALGNLGDERAVAPLVAALGIDGLRMYATNALQRLGQLAIKDVTTSLQAPIAKARGAAAEILGSIGTHQSVQPLVRALQDRHHHVRVAAERALSKIDWEPASPEEHVLRALALGDAKGVVSHGVASINPLCLYLESPETSARVFAATTLGMIGGDEAVRALVTALEDEHEGVRKCAAEALGSLGNPLANSGLAKIVQHDSRLRETAIQSLITLGSASVEVLVILITDEQPEVRRSAAKALRELRDPRSEVALSRALADDDQFVRQQAAQALNLFGTEQAVSALSQALTQSDRSTRLEVAAALARIQDPRAIPPLVAQLTTIDDLVRAGVVRALEELKWQPVSVEDRLTFLIEKRQVDHIASFGDAFLTPLLKILKAGSETQQKVAAEALGELGDNRAVEALIVALADLSYLVRCSAANALGKIGNQKAISRLRLALIDKDLDVRDAAQKALTALDPENVAGYVRAGKTRVTQREQVGQTGQRPLSDQEMIATLVQLCRAYAANDRRAISDLEPVASKIGRKLNKNGGISEMRRIFGMVPDLPGKRTVEMHWDGIGDWAG